MPQVYKRGEHLIKVAGLAVSAVESFDRKRGYTYTRPEINDVLMDFFEAWGSTFGLTEFEQIAKNIVTFLKSDKPSKNTLLHSEPGSNWSKKFTLHDVTENESMFAVMCMQGYFQHHWFPKGTFIVTDEFIKRCPLATYQERFQRHPESRGYPNQKNNYKS